MDRSETPLNTVEQALKLKFETERVLRTPAAALLPGAVKGLILDMAGLLVDIAHEARKGGKV